MLRCGCIILTVTAVFLSASVAEAETLITFGNTDLSVQYNAGTRLFQLDERVGAQVRTQGDVTRVVPPGAGTTAIFDWAEAGIGAASIDFDVTLGALSGGQIPASGTFALTDINGDQVLADTQGVFRVNVANEVQYEGILTNVLLPSNPYDGVLGSSVDISPASFGGGVFQGTVIIPRIEGGAGGGLAMFQSDIVNGTARNFDGAFTPEPTTALLLGALASACLLRRRAV